MANPVPDEAALAAAMLHPIIPARAASIRASFRSIGDPNSASNSLAAVAEPNRALARFLWAVFEGCDAGGVASLARRGPDELPVFRCRQRAAHPGPDRGHDLAAAGAAVAGGGLARTFCRRLVPTGGVFAAGRIPRD